MAVLEKGRTRPPPQPRQGRRGADVAPAPRAPAKPGRRRKRRKKGDRMTDPQSVAGQRAIKSAKPKVSARAGPLGPATAPQCTASGKKGAATVSRAVPPGQVAPSKGGTHGHPGGDR